MGSAPSTLTGELRAKFRLSAFSPTDGLRRLWDPHPDSVPAVTGFRALSVLWVIVQHVQQGLRPLGLHPVGARFLNHPVLRLGWAGNLAVDIFFVLSGYLIGGMLMSEREETGHISFARFYLRRAMRIFPAYWLALAVNVALSEPKREAIWANLLFVNNFIPFQSQFMAHTWSLAIEEQFYAFFPLCVLLLYTARAAHRNAVVICAIALSCVLTVTLVRRLDLELSLTHSSPVQFWRYMDLFYVRPYARFGSLFIGVLVARLEGNARVLAALARPRLAFPLLLVALAVMAWVTFVFPECRTETGAPRVFGSYSLALGGYAFSAGIGYLLLLSRTQAAAGRLIARVLGVRVLHPIAQLSYAAFLIHPLVVTPLYGPLGFDLARPELSYAKLVLCAWAVSFAAALVVYLIAESPLTAMRPSGRARPAR